MASELLAIGSGPANSADVTVDEGEQLTVCLKDTAGPKVHSGRVEVQLKDDDAEYFTIATLNNVDLAIVLVGPGVYRFRRSVGACGVFSG